MYYTHKFRDPETKKDVVISNTEEMMFSYFWATFQTRYPSFTGMSIGDIDTTKRLIHDWVAEHFADANLTTIADFISRLVDDYDETVDREASNV